MIRRTDIERLVQRERRPDSPVLSLYLNVDPSRSINLNGGFTTVARNLLRSIEQQLDAERRAHFAADAARVLRWLD
jgi:hypothetical protein